MGCSGCKHGLYTRSSRKEANLSKAQTNSFTETMNFLNKVQLFHRLPKDEHPLLAQVCDFEKFRSGETIIMQGDVGSALFVIKDGRAVVNVSEKGAPSKKVATLKSGDHFGETALLRDEPRAATIIADSDVEVLKITRDKFKEFGLDDKLHFGNRRAVGAGGKGRTIETKSPSSKTAEEKVLIAEALRANENLQMTVSLDDVRIESMIAIAWKERVLAGEALITEGDTDADFFFVVQEGLFEIYVSHSRESEERISLTVGKKLSSSKKPSKLKPVGTVSKGGSFGELALLYYEPRAATVKAKEDSVVWVFDRQSFKDILMKASGEKLDEYVPYLDKVDVLSPLLAEEKKDLARALVEMHFVKDEIILQQGQPGDTMYILFDGEVEVLKNGVPEARLAARKSRKEVKLFGDRALLDNEPRSATVKVCSETARALTLDRGAFSIVIGAPHELTRCGDGPCWHMPNRAGMVELDKHRDKILKKDLNKVGLIGAGGFGVVELYEHKITKDTYAMKALSKGYIVKTGMQENVLNEKNILLMTRSPFIIKLWETYNGAQTLYFLLEPALGGEVYTIYNRKGFYGSETHAKFYAAGTISGIEHMHTRRIIYRDLKPENLLLNDMGQVKITDMGLAKFVVGKTYTTCGTPEYFAPEMIQAAGHTNAVDWWSLGILLFELMTGRSPFHSANPMQAFAKIMKGLDKFCFPSSCCGDIEDLIRNLLKSDPTLRLPMRPGGIQNLKDHPWYVSFDWEAYSSLEMEPPYKPHVKNKKDVTNFSVSKLEMPCQMEYEDDGSGWDKDFATV